MSCLDDTVDFVLVYKENRVNSEEHNKRNVFEKNLVEEGLQIQKEGYCGRVFVILKASNEALFRYCEIMKFRMPIKKSLQDEFTLKSNSLWNILKVGYKKATDKILRNSDTTIPIENTQELTAEFHRDRHYLFDTDDPNFFTQSVRTSIVAFILERVKFSSSDQIFDFGIEKLISDDVYECGFPIHDGGVKDRGTTRHLLHKRWAKLSRSFALQPLNLIKEYLGVKVALYFAWLGFYNSMLIPASIAGILSFVYGLITLNHNAFSNDICNRDLNITMCPQCDHTCDYWKLDVSCVQAKVTYIFDNPFTVAFSIFMSLWASFYLELWKRYSASLMHDWGMTGFDKQSEHPRPQYLAMLSKYHDKSNAASNIDEEPSVSFWRVKLPSMLLSYSIATVVIMLSLIGVISVILYRMSLFATTSFWGSPEEKKYKTILVSVSAAFINLIFITIMDMIYGKTAIYLTEKEMLRTQTEFDDSLTLKVYLFKFVNYYASIFYLAFFKGKMVGYPSKYNRIFGLRQEECGPGGCFLGLFIQIAIIMVLKNFIATLIQETILFFKRQWKKKLFLFESTNEPKPLETDTANFNNRWLDDYKLLPVPPRGLFDEYLEMILQYGFVTIFVAACPLAPLWALTSNILEIRLDAIKHIKVYRRPIPSRSSGIGVWYEVMDVLGRLAVITNAFILAFTSNFIPRLVYVMTVSQDSSETGFLEHSLSYFNTSDFQTGTPNNSTFGDVQLCRYMDYRNPPWVERKYKRPEMYWHILAARFAFIVVFQNIVNILRIIIKWAIPDIPRELKAQIKREVYVTNEIIIKEEASKSKGKYKYR